MKLAYGTYGLPGVMPEDAAPRLAEIGYEGLEITAIDRFCADPDKMDAARREKLRDLLQEHGMAVPSIMLLLKVMGDEEGLHEQNLKEFRKAAQLSADLTVGRTPVVTSTMGGGKGPWEDFREELVRRLGDYAKIAEELGVVFAIEPHVGGQFDVPEKAVWVMDNMKHPSIKVNFDISHFAVVDMTIDQCVPVLVPHAVHTHVKDGRMVDGKVKFLLPGEGDFDYAAYFKAMADAGWDDFITVEVSGMVSNRPDYEPYQAAQFCFDVLSKAMEEAGIAR
ncbi:MAG: sugar phosphate isomerase/epimerase [Planctomycetes bacterium]|nr:sugar phosphate isomerase/epimerase [Planctomycetota bacterium]